CVTREIDASRFAFSLDPCGYVDAIAKDIVTVDDDVSDVDADAKGDLWRPIDGTVCHLGLDRHRAGNRVHSAGELDEHAVAGGLDDAPFMLGDDRIKDFAPDRLQSRKGTDLVGTHKPRIASDISRQHRCQSPLDAHARHEALA